MKERSPQAEWDALAADYERSVLSVFDCDREGAVKAAIEAACTRFPNGRAADLGCGVGKFLPALAAHFASVEACDFSPHALARAKDDCRELDGIAFHEVDLRSDGMPFEPVDCVLCVNVLHMPDLDERLRAWRAVTNQVAFGGTLILVLPSLEAVKREQFRELETHLEAGASCADALEAVIAEGAVASDLYQGIHRLDGIRTKHYLADELGDLLAQHQFSVESMQRLPYRHPASGRALPFEDWLVVANRRNEGYSSGDLPG